MIALFAIAALVLIGVGGWLAAADAALSVLSRTDLIEISSRSRAGKSLRSIASDMNAHSNASNFMRVLAETTAAVLVTLALAYVLDWWWALLAATLIMTVVSFVLVGSSPRAFGRIHAETVIRWSAPIVRTSRSILGPLASVLVAFGDRVVPGKSRTVSFANEDQLLSMVDEATEMELLEEDDRELIHSIFEFNDTVVREVMVPRIDMITLDETATVDQAMSRFLESGVSRIPVVGTDIDEIRGVLYLRDLARIQFEKPSSNFSLTKLIRPAMFVPDSKKVDDLLRQMQLESNHLAMVVDEYGGIAGLVTMEDLIEELVGDISDEYDRDSAEVQELGEGKFRVSGRLPIDELGELFDLELEDEDVDTVGGLLTKQLGRLPRTGSRVETSGLSLLAERTENRGTRVRTVMVERVEKPIQETPE